MFDTHIHPTRVESVTRNVHEHRAPTDESIKIYREMVEKAKAEVLELTLNGVEGNILNHVKLSVQGDIATNLRKYRFAFKLNGKPISIDFQDDEAGWAMLKDELARAVVDQLLRHVGDQLWQALPGPRR